MTKRSKRLRSTAVVVLAARGLADHLQGDEQPAASLPLHWTPDGLPVGVQAVARFGQEATLFSFAAQIEQARPWSQHLPTAVADMG